jgi:hypothetical protein
MGLTILITNIELDRASGTTLYVRDLAMQLKRRGHVPMVYTEHLGSIARQLQSAGILVTRHLGRLLGTPDLVHAHHWIPAREVLRRFPTTPAVYVCHDHVSRMDGAVLHPRIRRYFGVSQLCVDRLVHDGVPRERIALLNNFVDTKRFVTRPPLPPRAARALVFSNYAHRTTHLPAVTQACREAGLELDVMGHATGRFEANPERRLSAYDIVFAKAKAALEAMATGSAVILCDYGGVGPMVTPDNFDELRLMNFGFQSLTDPLDAACVRRQIERYDPHEAARVCETVRETASLEAATDVLCDVYRQVIDDWAGGGSAAASQFQLPRSPRKSLQGYVFSGWARTPQCVRRWIKGLPGMQSLISRFWNDKSRGATTSN